jgi:hypothetical protein
MKLLDQIKLVNNVFEVRIGLADVPDAFTAQETAAITQLGEWTIATGGTITETSPAITFELPVVDKQFPSQFPVAQKFSRADFADANDRAIAYRNIIKERLIDARDAALLISPGTIATNITEV